VLVGAADQSSGVWTDREGEGAGRSGGEFLRTDDVRRGSKGASCGGALISCCSIALTPQSANAEVPFGASGVSDEVSRGQSVPLRHPVVAVSEKRVLVSRLRVLVGDRLQGVGLLGCFLVAGIVVWTEVEGVIRSRGGCVRKRGRKSDLMPRPALRILDGGLDTTVESRWFCGYCAALPRGDQDPQPFWRVCASCGAGVLLETRADAVPSDRQAFLIVDGRMLVQAISREAQTLLAISKPDVIATPVSELLISADAESADRDRFASAIAEAAQGLDPDNERNFVRPWNTFGVRMRVRVATCGPPRAALVVLGNDPRAAPRRSSNVISLRAIR
jgi:hypothetical protein